MATVARNLARARELREMTQLAAANAVGVDPQMLARWERGDTWINPGHLKLLSDVYTMGSVDVFFQDDPPALRPDSGSGATSGTRTRGAPGETRPRRPHAHG